LITEHIGNKPIYFGIYISLISLLGALGGMLILNSGKNKGRNIEQELQPMLQTS